VINMMLEQFSKLQAKVRDMEVAHQSRGMGAVVDPQAALIQLNNESRLCALEAALLDQGDQNEVLMGVLAARFADLEDHAETKNAALETG
jgi:hypothetical protein